MNSTYHHEHLSDSEASNMASIFSRAAEAIVAATRLPREIEALRAQIQRLEGELEDTQYQAATLSRNLDTVRHGLAEANGTIAKLNARNSELVGTIDKNDHHITVLRATVDRQDKDLGHMHKELEDAELNGLDLECQLEDANKTLGELRGTFERIFGTPKLAPANEQAAALATVPPPTYSLSAEREAAFPTSPEATPDEGPALGLEHGPTPMTQPVKLPGQQVKTSAYKDPTILDPAEGAPVILPWAKDDPAGEQAAPSDNPAPSVANVA